MILNTMTLREQQIYFQIGEKIELDMNDLARFLGYKKKRYLLNAISNGTCPVVTYKRSVGRFTNVNLLASYQEKLEQDAKSEFDRLQESLVN